MAIGTTAAIVGASVIGAGAGLHGASQSSSAAKKAASAQADAAKDSNALQWNMYQQSRTDQEPWRKQGEWALAQLGTKIAAGPGSFATDPGYQFTLSEGQKALDRSAAAKGALGSGAAIKDTVRFGQNMASTQYDNWLNRYYQSLTPYQSLAGIGQTAANNNSQAAMQTGNAMAANTQAAGNARASGYVNQANALNAGLSGVTNAVGGGVNNYLLMNALGKA